MKFLIVFVALFAVALAAPTQDAEIVKYDSEVLPGGYTFAVQTSDGAVRSEEGTLDNAGTDHESLSVHGSYKYVGDDGVTYEVTYVADENGFQPSGAHIPQPQ